MHVLSFASNKVTLLTVNKNVVELKSEIKVRHNPHAIQINFFPDNVQSKIAE